MNKKEIRKKLNIRRNNLTSEEINSKSVDICTKLSSLDVYKKADNILLFASYKSEVDTSYIFNLAKMDGKKVFFPRVLDNLEMEFRYVTNISELQEGYQGILEPMTGEIYINSENSLVIMPGLGFDLDLNRIGYGGGYYDYFLSNHSELYKIFIAFDIQKIDSIPSEATDIKPDLIITENNIYYGE